MRKLGVLLFVIAVLFSSASAFACGGGGEDLQSQQGEEETEL